MSTQDEHIREIFSKSLKDFEAPVDPGVWAGVQSGIGAGAAGAGSAGVGGFGLLKIVAAVVLTGSLITAVVLTSSDEEGQDSTTQVEEVSDASSDVKSADDNASISQADQDVKPEVNEEIVPESNPESGELPGVANSDSEEQYVEVAPSQQPDKEIKSFPIGRGAPQEGTPPNPVETTPEESTNDVEAATIEVDAEFVAVQDEHEYNLFQFSPVAIMDGEYAWDFGDGETSSGSQTFHEYFDDGEFTVTLSVTVGEQIKQQEVKILVVEPSQISVPNVFSPNGDSWNNYFDIEAQSRNIELITLVVFDPQGNKVFEADEYRKKWDGNDLFGNPCRGGIYTYWFEAHGSDGKHWKEPGTVTLME